MMSRRDVLKAPTVAVPAIGRPFMAVAVRLPLVPSTNNLFSGGSGKRRFVSREYQAWRTEAGLMLNRAKLPKITGVVNITLTHTRPSKRRMDVDNRIKAALDLLVGHGVLVDDSQVHSVTSRWNTDPFADPGTLVEITDWI